MANGRTILGTAQIGKIIGREFARIRERLEHPDKALEALGEIIVSRSQNSFKEQRLGEHQWPRRYDRMPDPFINIAGALHDIRFGGNIKSRRFDRIPALRDTGALFLGIKVQGVRPEAGTVEVGVRGLPYASIHQEGGESEQPITKGTKERIREAIGKFQRAEKRAGMRKPKGEYEKVRAAWEKADLRARAVIRLAGLLRKGRDTLVTKVFRRPFIGITRQDAEEMIADVEEVFGGKARISRGKAHRTEDDR